MSAQETMLAALKAAEPVLAEFERIVNKRMPGSFISIPELGSVRAAIEQAEMTDVSAQRGVS